MKFKQFFIINILLITATIMTTSDSIPKNKKANGKGDLNIFRKAMQSIKQILNMNSRTSTNIETSDPIKSKNATKSKSKIFKKDSNTFTNFKSSYLSRKFYKVVGFAPIVKKDDIGELLELIFKEPDLIKIGAFKKLDKMSNKPKDIETRNKLIFAKLQATIELIKYYDAVYNFPNVVYTFAQGMFYAHNCEKLYKDNLGNCLKKKALLLATFMFSYKNTIRHLVKGCLRKTIIEAKKHLKDNDKTIRFIETKIACEEVLKSRFGSKKEKADECIKDLLSFENHLEVIGSYPGSYHFFLAKIYDHQGNNELTLEHLMKARVAEVFDSKTRNVNNKVQELYEKKYLQIHSSKK